MAEKPDWLKKKIAAEQAAKSSGKFARIMYPLNQPGRKKRWIRIGSCTITDNGLACTIESVPLNWTGEFFIFDIASDEAGEDTEVKGDPT